MPGQEVTPERSVTIALDTAEGATIDTTLAGGSAETWLSEAHFARGGSDFESWLPDASAASAFIVSGLLAESWLVEADFFTDFWVATFSPPILLAPTAGSLTAPCASFFFFFG
jgi:hypothetical protein